MGKWPGALRSAQSCESQRSGRTAGRGMVLDAQRAIAAAKAAQPAWAERTFVERAQVLSQGLDRFVSGTEARVPLYARENGRILAEALVELRGVPVAQKLMLELAAELDAGRQLRRRRVALSCTIFRTRRRRFNCAVECAGYLGISPRDTWRSPVGRADVPLR